MTCRAGQRSAHPCPSLSPRVRVWETACAGILVKLLGPGSVSTVDVVRRQRLVACETWEKRIEKAASAREHGDGVALAATAAALHPAAAQPAMVRTAVHAKGPVRDPDAMFCVACCLGVERPRPEPSLSQDAGRPRASASTPTVRSTSQVYAANPVSAAQEAALSSLESGSSPPPRASSRCPASTSPTLAWFPPSVPYDKLDAVAALPWVTALRPSLRPAAGRRPDHRRGRASCTAPTWRRRTG